MCLAGQQLDSPVVTPRELVRLLSLLVYLSRGIVKNLVAVEARIVRIKPGELSKACVLLGLLLVDSSLVLVIEKCAPHIQVHSEWL